MVTVIKKNVFKKERCCTEFLNLLSVAAGLGLGLHIAFSYLPSLLASIQRIRSLGDCDGPVISRIATSLFIGLFLAWW